MFPLPSVKLTVTALRTAASASSGYEVSTIISFSGLIIVGVIASFSYSMLIVALPPLTSLYLSAVMLATETVYVPLSFFTTFSS